MIYKGVVVTGTDTGVGKTVVACALASLLLELGCKVGVLKPVETGCEGDELAAVDALALAASAGYSLSLEQGEESSACIGMDKVVPWRFKDPVSPEEAASISGVEITVDKIYQAMNGWMERSAVVVVETAGGVMAPVNPRFYMADLIQGFELPVVVVAPNRLGVINHALLTIEAIQQRGVTTVAVVLNRVDESPDQSAGSNADTIERHGGLPVIEVPHAHDKGPVEEAKNAIRPHMKELMQAMERDWMRVLQRYAGRKQG